MERISRLRAVVLVVLFAFILTLFSFRLFKLQIIDTKGNTDNTVTYGTITTVRAARGDILDRNGKVLVGNRASYDLVFNHYVIKSADDRKHDIHGENGGRSSDRVFLDAPSKEMGVFLSPEHRQRIADHDGNRRGFHAARRRSGRAADQHQHDNDELRRFTHHGQICGCRRQMT